MTLSECYVGTLSSGNPINVTEYLVEILDASLYYYFSCYECCKDKYGWVLAQTHIFYLFKFFFTIFLCKSFRCWLWWHFFLLIAYPTSKPSKMPSIQPSKKPTTKPTQNPTKKPTGIMFSNMFVIIFCRYSVNFIVNRNG